jgi:DNA-binding beta-propeller fold protein YncE
MRRIATLVVLPLLSLVACKGSTEPDPAVSTHPAGTLAGRVSGLTGRPFGIRVSTDGAVFVTQQDANSVARFGLGDLVQSSAIPVGGDPGDVVFTHDGKTAFVSNFFEGTVHALDVATGARTRILLVDPANAYRLALSPDDSRLYVTSMSGRLYAVDLAGTQATSFVTLGGALQGMAISRDGAALFVSNNQGALWRLNAATLAVVASRNTGAFPTQEVVLAPDETELYVANESGFVDVLNPSTLQPARRYDTPGMGPFGLAVTPDGVQLYVTSPSTGQLGIIDRATGSVVVRTVGGVPRRVAFDASGATAVIANEGNWADVVR